MDVRSIVTSTSILLLALNVFFSAGALSPSSDDGNANGARFRKDQHPNRRQIFQSAATPCGIFQSKRYSLVLRASTDDDDNDDDDDDDDDYSIDDASLDWRKFRASLIDEGLPGEVTSQKDGKISDSTTNAEDKKKTRKSVAVQNEKLLEEQNAQLAEEYKTGIWAHTVPQAEVGGLLCRMPLEAELYLGNDGGYWKQKLDLMLTDAGDDKAKGDVVKGLRLDEDPETVTISRVDQ